jgi:quercetin dioxygenase-like cupin family protein
LKENKTVYERNMTNVLNKDGVSEVQVGRANQIHYRASDYIEQMKDAPWADRIIYNESVSAVLVCQKPGTGNRTHFHREHDEWWVVLQGKINWWIEGIGEIHAGVGDIVFVPRGVHHKIRTAGDGPSIRLAISPPDIPHFHPEIDPAPETF